MYLKLVKKVMHSIALKYRNHFRIIFTMVSNEEN
jgi:hypothetical protein